MVRARRISLIAALLLLVASLIARVGLSLKDPFQGMLYAVLLGWGYVVITALLVLFVTALAAIPSGASGGAYGRRMWLRLPFVMLFTVVFMSIVVYYPEWWAGKHGLRPFTDRPYEEVPTADEADCSTVREGAFRSKGLWVERRGSRQYQRDEVLGAEEDLEIAWSSPCEYILIGEDSLSTLYVKIIGVDPDGYECLVYPGAKGSTGYALRLERVKLTP